MFLCARMCARHFVKCETAGDLGAEEKAPASCAAGVMGRNFSLVGNNG